jgi:hypothetical protein
VPHAQRAVRDLLYALIFIFICIFLLLSFTVPIALGLITIGGTKWPHMARGTSA